MFLIRLGIIEEVSMRHSAKKMFCRQSSYPGFFSFFPLWPFLWIGHGSSPPNFRGGELKISDQNNLGDLNKKLNFFWGGGAKFKGEPKILPGPMNPNDTMFAVLKDIILCLFGCAVTNNLNYDSSLSLSVSVKVIPKFLIQPSVIASNRCVRG